MIGKQDDEKNITPDTSEILDRDVLMAILKAEEKQRPYKTQMLHQIYALNRNLLDLAEAEIKNVPFDYSIKKVVEIVYVLTGTPKLGKFKSIMPAAEPPALGETLLGLFATKRQRESLLGDFSERFETDIASGMSPARAKRRYWTRVLVSVGPQMLAAIKRLGFWAILGKLLTGGA